MLRAIGSTTGPNRGRVKTAGSIKVARTLAGHPALVVGTDDVGYEVQEVLVTRRTAFQRSYQAVRRAESTPNTDAVVRDRLARARTRLSEYDLACEQGPLGIQAHRWLGALSEQLRLVLDAVDEHFDGYPSSVDEPVVAVETLSNEVEDLDEFGRTLDRAIAERVAAEAEAWKP